MNEQDSKFFQVPPFWEDSLSEMGYRAFQSKCMFMGEMFDIDDVRHVSPVEFKGPQYYTFEIMLGSYNGDIYKTLEIPFTRKDTALKASRELCRAWTRTGEYAYEQKEEVNDTEKNVSNGLRKPDRG